MMHLAGSRNCRQLRTKVIVVDGVSGSVIGSIQRMKKRSVAGPADQC
jgi:hypothetical protein